jgi:hypothetical protein
MVKNCILWLTLSLLLTVTSATACYAGPNESKNLHSECYTEYKFCEHNNQERKDTNAASPDQKKETSIRKESSPSILNSNFIFYIIYKYKFMEISSSDNELGADNDDKVFSPLEAYLHKFLQLINYFINNLINN